jgi:hypothetical protein
MIGAYACSAVTVTLLWMLVRRNQAQGWRRERHPNCFSPMSRSAPSASASIPQVTACPSVTVKGGHVFVDTDDRQIIDNMAA